MQVICHQWLRMVNKESFISLIKGSTVSLSLLLISVFFVLCPSLSEVCLSLLIISLLFYFSFPLPLSAVAFVFFRYGIWRLFTSSICACAGQVETQASCRLSYPQRRMLGSRHLAALRRLRALLMPCHAFCWHPDLCHNELMLAPAPGLSQTDRSRPLVRRSAASACDGSPHATPRYPHPPPPQMPELRTLAEGGDMRNDMKMPKTWHIHMNADTQTEERDTRTHLNVQGVISTRYAHTLSEWHAIQLSSHKPSTEVEKEGVKNTGNAISGFAGRLYVSNTRVRVWLTLVPHVCQHLCQQQQL